MIGVPLSLNWIMAKISTVGVMATMREFSSGSARIRPILPSGSLKPV